MKTYKTTEKQIEFIVDGMNNFIDFVHNCYSDCFMYYGNMNETNEKYKQNPATFFDSIGVDKDRFFNGLFYYRLLPIAENVKYDIYNVHNTVIGLFIDPQGGEYPIKIEEWLHTFKLFCYDKDGNFLSLEEQNNRLKNYPHFDASTKRPKCYNMQ